MNAQKLKDRLNTKVQGVEEGNISMDENALVTADSNYTALNNNALDIIKELCKCQE